MQGFSIMLCLCGLLLGGLQYSPAESYAAPVDTPAKNEGGLSMPKKNADGNALGENGSAMTDIHDIKSLSPVVLPMSRLVIALIVLIGVLVLAMVIAGWFFWRRRKRTLTPELEIPPPDTVAFQRLAELDKNRDMNDKAYYVSLSSIFREYIEGRYGIDGLEMTTEELLPNLDKINIDKALRQDAKAFVSVCDPVKFADVGVTESRKEFDFKLVKAFVEKTMVVESELGD